MLATAQGQNRVGDWQIYTSILDVRSVVYSQGELLAATSGGIIRYDPATGILTKIDPNNGLEVSDIMSMARAGDWLWMGSAAPEGVIQLRNLVDGRQQTIDLKLGEITHIIADSARGFVAFADGLKIGLVELRLNGDGFEYYYEQGIRVTLNTDNRLVSDTTLSKEYLVAHETFGLTLNDFREIIINGFKSSFMSHQQRSAMIRKVVDELESEFSVEKLIIA